MNKEEQKIKKERYNKKYREANREKAKLYAREFRKKGRATRDLKKQNRSIKDWEKKNPEKRSAHREVFKAKRNGTLVSQPCKECGNTNVQAHHEDYSKPLEVIWLCRIHHYEYDKRLKEKGV